MFPSPGIFASIGLLLMRVSFGGLLAWGHGYGKLMKFNDLKDKFPDPVGWIPAPHAFTALVGAEFVCAILVVVGLLTRVASLPIVYAMGVAAFVFHAQDPTFFAPDPVTAKFKELSLLYMAGFAGLFFTGPGMFSIDALLFGRRRPPETP